MEFYSRISREQRHNSDNQYIQEKSMFQSQGLNLQCSMLDSVVISMSSLQYPRRKKLYCIWLVTE